MASELTPTQIISLGKICQVLAVTDRGRQNASKGGFLDERLPIMLYNERKAVEYVNNTNPGDPQLQFISNYYYELLAPYVPQAIQIQNNLAQSPPVITGPANQSGLVGFTAVFSVSVVSALPVTYQWFDFAGNPIPGATNSSYSFVNAQILDSGKTFFVKATNAAGQSVSNTATLTVTASITVQVYYGDTDYSAALLSGTDNVPYMFNFTILHNASLPVQFPGPVADKYIVVQYPDTEPTKINYNNPPIDSAAIPGFAFNATAFTGKKYVFSRAGNPFTVNSSNLLTLN